MSNHEEGYGEPHLADGQQTAPNRQINPRRRIPLTILAVVVSIAAASIVTTAVIYWPKDAAREPAQQEPTGTAPSTTPEGIGISVGPYPTGGSYAAVSQPCTAIGWGPLSTQVGRKGNDPQEDRSATGNVVSMNCSTILGEGQAAGVAMAEITIINNGSAQGMYEGLRAAIPADTVLTPVSGLGTAAYAYVEKDLGPALVAYDGNLYIRLVWAPLEKQKLPMYGGVVRALTEVCTRAMHYLRSER
ncbi:hypothetical protein [Plantactinospora sp. CA-290183]|uniref:hypothetical protein n=1 Tax=Plantactinospora sp. CA-290183 TaxID=3240006 RepID=UPI003D916938